MSKLLFLIVLIFALVAGIAYVKTRETVPSVGGGNVDDAVSYACEGGKTIRATFEEGVELPTAPDGRPQPSGRARVELSDGRMLDLAQTVSADGVRYANEGESFVFWSKGNGALVLEDNREKSYIGCISVVPDPGGLPQVYADGSDGFSIRYPAGYSADESYRYLGLGERNAIEGVKFTIAPQLSEGTNLGSDSYVSVETLSGPGECVASRFVSTESATTTVEEEGTTYSFASSSDAAAGNRYEEQVYALPHTVPCVAIRYMIYYGVFENYQEGTVRRFDLEALMAEFDRIRRTLTII